jgi:Fe-S-cluster containining protein
MRCAVSIPATPLLEHEVIPILGQLADVITGAVGNCREITCRPGCGTCCQQLVPVSVPELRQLSMVLAEHSQSERIVDRYRKLHNRLRTAGLSEPVKGIATSSKETIAQLAREYFHLGVSCPFLGDGHCLIYPNRPLACREYLVTSPAIECSRPEQGNVKRIRLPVSLAARVAANAYRPGRHSMAFLPDPVEYEDTQGRPAAEWLQRLLARSPVGV